MDSINTNNALNDTQYSSAQSGRGGLRKNNAILRVMASILPFFFSKQSNSNVAPLPLTNRAIISHTADDLTGIDYRMFELQQQRSPEIMKATLPNAWGGGHDL